MLILNFISYFVIFMFQVLIRLKHDELKKNKCYTSFSFKVFLEVA